MSKLIWLGLLLIVAYAPALYRLAQQWMNDPNMGHGIFVPIVAVWIAWGKRGELATIKPYTNWLGIVFVLWASLQLLIGTLGAELFLSRTAFLIALIGAVLFLYGTETLKVFAFPLFLLFFMIPIPKILFNHVTLPLQEIASGLAALMLQVSGIHVTRMGNILELPSQSLNVVEACSGIRSLLSMSFLALVYGYFFDSRNWIRIVLLIASIPITIIANAGRVTLTGILSEYNIAAAEGFIHMAEGWVVFVISLMILFVFHRSMQKVYPCNINLRWS